MPSISESRDVQSHEARWAQVIGKRDDGNCFRKTALLKAQTVIWIGLRSENHLCFKLPCAICCLLFAVAVACHVDRSSPDMSLTTWAPGSLPSGRHKEGVTLGVSASWIMELTWNHAEHHRDVMLPSWHP